MKNEAALIYHTGALGDFITTIPALRYWKNRNKTAAAVLLGRSPIGLCAQENGLIDEVYEVNDKKFLPLFYDDFSPEAGSVLSAFQTAILFSSPDSPIVNHARQSGIPSLYWQPPFPAERMHTTDYHLSLFTDPQLLCAAEKTPRIIPSEKLPENKLEFNPDNLSPVALHPGSGSRKKNWPFERFVSLADTLRRKGHHVVWLVGPAEQDISFPIMDLLVSNQPLSLCAALLARCFAFVGNDSGMAHLAAAVGCRTVVLFGPSDPAVWAPRGRDVRIIYKKKPCSPCHRTPARCKECDGDCLSAITVEDVFEKI
jgi:heptosyltransferase-3